MKSRLTVLVAFVLISGITAIEAHAQRGVGERTGIAQQAVKPEVVSLTGKLKSIVIEPCEKTTGCSTTGAHVLLETTEGAQRNIHLGPAKSVDNIVDKLVVGQEVTVQAFRTEKLPKDHYVAQSLKMGEELLSLRDENLRPVWARGSANGKGRDGAQPGMGNRRGPGQGRGPAYDRGRGPNRNFAPGSGRGQGRGAAFGQGPRSGRGPGWNQGRGNQGRGNQGNGGPGQGFGKGRGRGMMGRGPGSGMREDMTTLHAMFDSRDKINRTVKNLPDGAEATTESDDEIIAGLIQEHVPAMETRVHENKPLPPMTFHPVFVKLIKHADDYTLTYEETDKGMKVTYQADDPFVIMLVQEHAKLVSRFIKNGMEEIHKPYTLPKVSAEPSGRGRGPNRNFAPGSGRGQGRGAAFGQGPRGGRGPGWNQGRGNQRNGGPGQGFGKGQCLRCKQQLGSIISSLPKKELSDQEREGLLLMREEEKLAHDVYITLGKKWALRPLANIPQAESRHMEFVKTLLDRYNIKDPIADLAVGKFPSEKMQQLYDQLVSQGEKSVEEAIKVGALIEELDIADLRRLLEETDSDDIRVVYQNLLKGSRNHLRAFARQLDRYNISYSTRHLSQAEFDRIASSEHERGEIIRDPKFKF